jgi:hypothetical protein
VLAVDRRQAMAFYLYDRRALAAPVPARGFRQLWQLPPAAVEAITVGQSMVCGHG